MADEKLPAHPSRPVAIVLMALGGVFTALGAATMTPAMLVGGAFVILGGAFQWRMGVAAVTANSAAAAINRGELDRARQLVGRARAEHRLTYVHRLLDAHEGEIGWREGDLEAAKRALESGRARKDLIAIGAWRRNHIVHLDALYALTLAIGGEDRAEEFIKTVRGSEHAQPGPLARVELAHGMLLARRGDLNALHRHLMRNHVLLAESLDSRGRALHRVLRRMTATRATSAYRLPVRTAPAQGSSATWMARVFPQGAELLDVDDGAAMSFEAPKARAPVPVAAIPRRRRVSVVLVFAILIPVLLIFLMNDGTGRPPVATLGMLMAVFGFAFFAIMFFNVRRARAGLRVIEEAQRAMLSGELDRAESLARSQRENRNRILAAQSSLIITGILERRGDFAGALSEVQRGLGLLTGAAKLGTYDVLLPQLLSTRGYLFAALGRDDESDGDLARLANEFPAYPYAGGIVARTALLRAVRRGDLDTARQIARARGDITLGAYGEIVGDLVLAMGAEDERERMVGIREDMASLPHFDAWLKNLAPKLLTAST